MFFIDALRRSGLSNPIYVVRDGEEAISYLKGELRYADRDRFPMPGILVVDLAMPKVNGWQVLQWVKANPTCDHLLVVVLTNSLRAEDLKRAYQLGANSYLGKPCTVDELLGLEKAFPKYWSRSHNPQEDPLAPLYPTRR